MKFLIQKINSEIRHDFSFTLLESIRYHNWLSNGIEIKHKFIDYVNRHDNRNWKFKDFHRKYVPIGSVEFVNAFMKYFNIKELKPINVPDELIAHAGRKIYNCNHMDLRNIELHKFFLKSADKIKGTAGIFHMGEVEIPEGNYQLSNVIQIESEWRCFVYKNKLVGIQNYSGDFTIFPNIHKINEMIYEYKSAPIAYTLDVGVNFIGRSNELKHTFVIECHPMVSVGLYGFSDHRILPHMFNRAFNEIKTTFNRININV